MKPWYAFLSLVLLQAPTPAPQRTLPTFRTGVDIVELDVTVLDKDRHPITGLIAEDFTILDRGKPQPIVAFSAVDVPPPVAYPAPWMRDAPLDVVSNVENRRLVTVVMDDAYTAANPDFMKRAKQIARNAVDELGPADLAAVVFTFLGRRQNFTSDRSRLFAAIESFVPKVNGHGDIPIPCMALMHKCDIEALNTVADTLAGGPQGRKVVILIGGGRAPSFGGPGNTENETPELMKLSRDLQRGNVTVYAFDARGLMPPAGMSAEHRDMPTAMSSLALNESLYTFAESTGGRAFTNTNDPQSHVGEAFRESSSYYFIGFRSTADSNDKGLRKVEVKVNRPGVQVRARSGYYPATRTPATGDVINGLPGGDLPIHATAAALGAPGRPGAEVIIAARVEPAHSSTTIELSAMAIDLDAKPRGVQHQTIKIAPNAASGQWPDLPAHLPLAPGRYVVQVSAKSDDRSGSVAVDVDVPDFTKEPISASGLLLHHRRSAAQSADRVIADLIPFLPTTVRQFHSDDEVSVFVRIYQGGKGRVVPVKISAKVTNEKSSVTSNQEAVLEVENFSAARSADYQAVLPLAHLSPGAYLLEVDAQSGARRVKRSARFSVVPN
jgi:VWFA-related protein